MYAENDRVRFTYNAYSLTTDEFVGTVDVTATITRVWNSERYITLLTDDGKHSLGASIHHRSRQQLSRNSSLLITRWKRSGIGCRRFPINNVSQ